MGFTKITNTELNSRGATTLPNQPTISATALKQEFDAPAKNVVAPKVNNLIDELEASTSATSLGATAPTGFTGSTVQAVLNSIGATASSASSQAHSHSNKAVIDKFSEDSGGNPLYDGNPIVSGGGEWGTITGDLDDQTDLANALSAKADSSSLAGVATSGLYSDLSGTPSLATVATSGSYSDLSNKPTIPAVDQAYNSASTNAQSGTAVAGAIATKSAVAWSQTITTGQKIATVTIDGTPTDVYAPTGGGGGGGGAVDSVNGQTGTVVLDVDDINDVTIASIADQDTLVYNGTTHTWGNEPLADVALTGSYSNLTNTPSLATVATTGLYSDLSGTPTIPAAQIQSDWTQADNTKKDYIKNKPSIPDELSDLTGDVAISSPSSGQILQHNGTKWANANMPSIPTVNDSTITIQRNGTQVDTFTTNASSAKTINILDDMWSSATQVDSSSQVTFDDLDNAYGYDLYCDDKLIGISAMTKTTGTNTGIKLVYTVTGASQGDTCYLRILR